MRSGLTRGAFPLLAALLVPSALHAADRPVDFDREIRPLLSDKCFFCHGPDPKHREADLRLDVRDGIFGDRGGYAAVVPGKLDQSELVARITSDDEDMKMPPADSHKELTAEQIALLTRWIEQGAEWHGHWAYEPLVRPAVPDVENTGWLGSTRLQQDSLSDSTASLPAVARATGGEPAVTARNTTPNAARPQPPFANAEWAFSPIDRFILSRLQQEELSPSADADKTTLLRRLHFDLVGLPPSPDDVEAYLADDSPAAYERVVDRLLASPEFGERLAVFWLDLVRYADTVGYHGDQVHNIQPYRDYVIKSLNENLAFDQFTREQLAGDLLPEPTMWQRIATGYNRVLQTTHEGGAQDKEYLAKYSADRVRNASQVWLGSTLGCAECHDHKFDPFTQKDFYSFAAFFGDVTETGIFPGAPNANPTKRPPEVPVWNFPQYARMQAIDHRVAELNELRSATGAGDSLAGIETELAALRDERLAIEKAFPLCMVTVAKEEPRPIRLLPRGDWMDESNPPLDPAVPGFLPAPAHESRASRLDLANWIVSEENPLTARVFANRMWKLFFGHGLSANLDDVGAQGEPPDYPKLLDWLAVEFRDGGWDIKSLVRTIVTSHAYRQSSLETPELRRRDPQNRLLARQTRFRLPAEFVRDNLLAVSGLLVEEIGGDSARPYQPAGYYRHLNFPERDYHADTDWHQYRRGVYTHWQRQFVHPMLRAFDAPSREECTAQRPISNTPLAALTALNDPSFVEASRVLAAHAIEATPDEAARLQWMWRRVLSRDATSEEAALLKRLVDQDRTEYAADPKSADELLTVGLAPVPPGTDKVELAAWTSAARALLNLNEAMTRN